MSHFNMPASTYTSGPLIAVAPTDTARHVDSKLLEHDISAVGVVEDGALIGVISRTDLLSSADAEPGTNLRLPDLTARELMTEEPLVVADDTPLAQVAKKMLSERIHRVFVGVADNISGVISTRDLMRAVVDVGLSTPAQEIATKALVRVTPDDSIALAADRLDRSNKHGLVVVEDGWPVGTFSQYEALLSRAREPETSVDEVMNLQLLTLPARMPLARAAAQALELGVRRILLMEGDSLVGIVSSFDFARIVR